MNKIYSYNDNNVVNYCNPDINKIILTDDQSLELKRQEIENKRQLEVSEFIKNQKKILNQKILELNSIFDQELLNLEYEYKRRIIEKKKQEDKLFNNHKNQLQSLKDKQKNEKKNHYQFWNSIGGQLVQIRKYKTKYNTKIKPILYSGNVAKPKWNGSTLI